MCQRERIHARDELSQTDSSPDPLSLKPPKYASFMQIENDASSVGRSFLCSLLLFSFFFFAVDFSLFCLFFSALFLFYYLFFLFE